MEGKNKHQRGFIQIHLLVIAFLIIVISIGTGMTLYNWERELWLREKEELQERIEELEQQIKGLKQSQQMLPQLPPGWKNQPLPKEDSLLRIEQCKTTAEIQAQKASEEFATDLIKGINPDSTIEEKRNALELIKIIVEKERGKDYNRFYLNCLKQ